MNRPAVGLRLDGDTLRRAAGLGVAGNFAGHLEQAGEAADFVGVRAAAGRPKGVFPFYLPGDADKVPARLRVPPVSADTIRTPADASAHLQIEPELALWCALGYDAGGRVTAVTPRAFGAFNDCSWRNPLATKISEKKNWGPQSQGLAAGQLFPLENFSASGPLEHFRLASFLRREGMLHPYGEDAPVAGYGTLYGDLLDWLVDRLRHQRDDGPLEDVGAMLKAAGRPDRALIAIGATRYLPFGEATFLRPGDEAVVAVYDGREADAGALRAALADAGWTGAPWVSLLRQRVLEPGVSPAAPARSR